MSAKKPQPALEIKDDDDFVFPFSDAVVELLSPNESENVAAGVFRPVIDLSNLPRDAAYDDQPTVGSGALELMRRIVQQAVDDKDVAWLETDGNFLYGFTSVAHVFDRDPDKWRTQLLAKMGRRRCRN